MGFWTRKKKLLLLFLVLFVTLFYYFLAYGGSTIWSFGRINSREPFPFSYLTFFHWTWAESVNAHFWAEYFLVMSPFLLGYFFWWFKPNIWRFFFPALCMFLVIVFYRPWLISSSYMAGYSYSDAVYKYPDYAAQIPAWLRFLFLN